MYAHLKLDAPSAVAKLTNSNESLQTCLVCTCFDLFIAGTIVKFWNGEEDICKEKLEANLKAHNAYKNKTKQIAMLK